MKRDASWIASAVGGRLHGDNPSITALVETDSRRCEPGSLYIARVGDNADGHDFIQSAINNGAVCAIVERLQDSEIAQIVVNDSTVALGQLAAKYLEELRENKRIRVIGITGSVGKTTVKDLLGQILSAAGPTIYSVLSFNNEVGCPLTILRANEETGYLVLEMGASGPGHLRYLTQIAPLDVATVLMVGSAHLGGFGSTEKLALAKQELVEGLRPEGIAVLNADDISVREMGQAARGPVYYYGVENESITTVPKVNQDSDFPAAVAKSVWAQEVLHNGDGTSEFWLYSQSGERAWVSLGLVGEHQVANAVAAAASAWSVGVPLGTIAEQISLARPLSPHRMAIRNLDYSGKSILLIDDSYNANLDSMTAGLAAAHKLTQGQSEGQRLVVVLGQMLELGNESMSLHQEVGRKAIEAEAAVVICVGAEAVSLAEVTASHAETYICEDYREALRLLPGIIKSADTVFLKGSSGSEVWKIADTIVNESTTVSKLNERVGNDK